MATRGVGVGVGLGRRAATTTFRSGKWVGGRGAQQDRVIA